MPPRVWKSQCQVSVMCTARAWHFSGCSTGQDMRREKMGWALCWGHTPPHTLSIPNTPEPRRLRGQTRPRPAGPPGPPACIHHGWGPTWASQETCCPRARGTSRPPALGLASTLHSTWTSPQGQLAVASRLGLFSYLTSIPPPPLLCPPPSSLLPVLPTLSRSLPFFRLCHLPSSPLLWIQQRGLCGQAPSGHLAFLSNTAQGAPHSPASTAGLDSRGVRVHSLGVCTQLARSFNAYVSWGSLHPPTQPASRFQNDAGLLPGENGVSFQGLCSQQAWSWPLPIGW